MYEEAETSPVSFEQVNEPELLYKLKGLESNKDVVLQTDNIPSVDTLRVLATNLDYEIQMLVDAESDKTSYVPKTKFKAGSHAGAVKLGLGIHRSDTHNHPLGDPTPSMADLATNKREESTYLVISKDGVAEFSSTYTTDAFDDFYDYMIDKGNTPWQNGENYQTELQAQAEEDLKDRKLPEELTKEEREAVVKDYATTLDYRNYEKYFRKEAPIEETNSYMRDFLTSSDPPKAKFFTWEQKEEIESLIRGKSYLTS